MAKTATAPLRGIALGQTAMMLLPEDEHISELGNGFSVGTDGLVVRGRPAIGQATKTAKALGRFEKVAWAALGDLQLYAEEHYGEAASQIFDPELGYSQKTLDAYRWMAQRIAKERRRLDRLGVKHHMLVAALSAAKQKHWLDLAAADEHDRPWTAARLAAALKAGEDELPEAFWVLVSAANEQDQTSLQEQLERDGRSCKAVVRRKRTVES
jgi:hypothetical protein